MNTEHRYTLEKGSKKHHCPDCGKKRFVRFVDIETGEYLPEQYGRCDKGDGHYFLDPRKDGYAKMIWEQEQGNRSELPNNWKPQRKKTIPQPAPVFFDFETFKQTLEAERYEKNIFVQNLLNSVPFPFDPDDVTKVIELYRLGTVANGYRSGGITFPFIDIKGNVRAIQVKQFDEENHTTGTDFLHSIIEKHCTQNNKPLPAWLGVYTKQDKRITCLFGERLLNKYPNATVWLFEAPKTAIYAALYFGFPEQLNIICLAVYNKSSFSFDKLKVLKGRFVYVFPDLSKDGNTFKEWETKAKEYESRLPGTRFIFSDLLEQKATPEQREQGADIADILIKHDWRPFRKTNLRKQQPVASSPAPLSSRPIPASAAPKKEAEPAKVMRHPVISITFEDLFSDGEKVIEKEQPENWDNEIAEVESFFSSIELPTHPIRLNKCSVIMECRGFIDGHLSAVKGNNGIRTFRPYLDRLQTLKKILSEKGHPTSMGLAVR